MATIVKRRDRFCVVYMYNDSKGKRKQKWETYKTQAEAKVRLKEIEYKEQLGTFVVPQCKTMDDLLREYVSLYGKSTWALSTYSSNRGLINNYISPFIGSMKLKDVTPRVLEKYYAQLLKTKPVINPVTGKPKGEFVGTSTIRDVHPNPQSPIPNPQSPRHFFIKYNYLYLKYQLIIIKYKNIIINNFMNT